MFGHAATLGMAVCCSVINLVDLFHRLQAHCLIRDCVHPVGSQTYLLSHSCSISPLLVSDTPRLIWNYYCWKGSNLCLGYSAPYLLPCIVAWTWPNWRFTETISFGDSFCFRGSLVVLLPVAFAGVDARRTAGCLKPHCTLGTFVHEFLDYCIRGSQITVLSDRSAPRIDYCSSLSGNSNL